MTQAELNFFERVPNRLKDIADNLKPRKEIDWEQRRYEIAKDMMAAFMANSNPDVFACQISVQAEDAVKYADALIAKLKEGSDKADFACYFLSCQDRRPFKDDE